MQIDVVAHGKALPQQTIDEWEFRRLKAAAAKLQKSFQILEPARAMRIARIADLDALRTEVATAKLSLDPEEIRQRLRRPIEMSRRSARFMNVASLRRRKASVVELTCGGVQAQPMVEAILDLFTQNSERNRELTLLGSPDHYLLEGHGNGVQEIIETTGGAPLESQFFITYSDESEVSVPADPAYPLQITGVARLSDGTVVGSIRHQYRDEGSGFRAKLADEFPAAFPRYLIRAHQLHLACEFAIWYRSLAPEIAAL